MRSAFDKPAHGVLSLWLTHLLVLLVLAIALAATALVSLWHSNWPELLRRLAVAQLQMSLQREVTLAHLDLDPHGCVLLTNLRVMDAVSPHHIFFSAHQVSIYFDTARLLRDPGMPISSVHQMVVERPFISLARRANGAWNIDDLLRHHQPSADQFHGEVLVRNGEVDYQDAHGWDWQRQPQHEHLLHLTAHFLPASGGYSPFQITGTLANAEVRRINITGGVHLEHDDICCEVRCADISLAFIQRVLPVKLPLTLDAGRADGRWQFALMHESDTGKPKFRMTLAAELREVRGILKLNNHIPYHIKQGHLSLADHTLQLMQVYGEVGGVPVNLHGEITYFPTPIFALQIESSGVDTNTLVHQVPALERLPYTWGGTSAGIVQITGPQGGLHIIGHIRGPSCSASFGNYTDLNGDFAYYAHAITLTNLTGRCFEGNFSGNVWIALHALQPPSVYVDGQTEGVDLHRIITQFTPSNTDSSSQSTPWKTLGDLSGVVSGPVTISYTTDRRITVETHSHGTVAWSNLVQGEVDSDLQLNITQQSVEALISRSSVLLPEGYFQLQGTISSQDGMQLQVHGDKLSLPILGARLHRNDLVGSGYVSGELCGSFMHPSFTGSLEARNGSVAGHEFTQITSEVQANLGASPTVQLRKLQMLVDGNHLQLSGVTLTDFEHLHWAPTGKLVLLPTTFAALHLLIGNDIPLQGVVEGVVDFTKDTAHPNGTLLLRHPCFTIGTRTIEFDRANIHFAIQDDKVIIEKETTLRYHGTSITVAGTVPFDQHTFAPLGVRLQQIVAEELNLDDFSALTTCDDPHAGQFTSDARLLLPVDISGHFSLHGSVSASLVPGRGETISQVFLNTIDAHAVMNGVHGVSAAGVPFQQAKATLEYHGDNHMLTLTQFDLTRQSTNEGYHITLGKAAQAKVGSLNLLKHDIQLNLCLLGPGIDHADAGDLHCLREDMLNMAGNCLADSHTFNAQGEVSSSNHALSGEHHLPAPFDKIIQTLDSIPTPFAGHAFCTIALSGALQQPRITADFTCTDMILGGENAPNLDASLQYDVAPRILTVNHLYASNTADADAWADLHGAITLPGKDGQRIEMNLTANIQNVDASLLGVWAHNSWLKDFNGKATIGASITTGASGPQVVASLDIDKPCYKEWKFDHFAASLFLDKEGLWFGRWTNARTSAPVPAYLAARQAASVVFGNKSIDPELGATLQFIGAEQGEKVLPLQMIGYLPVRWHGLLKPYIPIDQPIFCSINLPKQGLDLVRSALPHPSSVAQLGEVPFPGASFLCALPQGGEWTNALRLYLTKPAEQAGTVESSLTVRGTLEAPQLDYGTFHLELPELRFASKNTDVDLPNRMRDIVLDLGFSSTIRNGHRVNLIKVNDLSTIFDRTEVAALQSSTTPSHLLNQLLGKHAPLPRLQGVLVAQGTILIDPSRVIDEHGVLLPLASLLNHLDYDLYAKTVRTPISWRNFLKGTLSGYARLGNDAGLAHLPLITGVVYLEKTQFTYGTVTSLPWKFTFPFDPQLSLALQAGAEDTFKLDENSPAAHVCQPDFSFMPTRLFPPFSQADKFFASQSATLAKPAVERDHPAYRYSAETLQNCNGTHGNITGTLSNPVIKTDFVLDPKGSDLRFLGGTLSVQEGSGEIQYPSDELASGGTELENTTPNRSSPNKLIFIKRGYATGYLSGYKVAASIDNEYLLQANGQMPIHFTTVSTPIGMPQLEENDIASRLFGMTDVAGVLQGQQTLWTPIFNRGTTYLIQGPMAKVARRLGLETFDLSMNESQVSINSGQLLMNAGQFPEATITTQEFGVSKWSAFRLGTSRVLSNPPIWKLWLDYRLPDTRFLRNVSITAQTNQQQENSVNLQYRWTF